MKTFLLIVAVLFSTNVLAWGDREQGALIGLAVGALVGSHSNQQRPQRVEQVYVVNTPPQIIHTPNGGYYIPPSREIHREVIYCHYTMVPNQFGSLNYIETCQRR